VEYYYRHPVTSACTRFKVYEDINRNKSVSYEKLLVDAVNNFLKEECNPFAEDNPYKPKVEVVGYTMHRALLLFLAEWKERGIDTESYQKYNQAVGILEQWLISKGMQFIPVADITQQHLETCLRHCKLQNKWSNRTYNNYKGFLFNCFIYLMKKTIIGSNPCADIKG